MYYITELDRPAYLLVPKREFFDREVGLTGEVLDYALKIQTESQLLQQWLRNVYSEHGDQSFKVEAPQWLVDRVNAARPETQDTVQVSSKKSPRSQKLAELNLSTKPSE